jgi:hypothetical protein
VAVLDAGSSAILLPEASSALDVWESGGSESDKPALDDAFSEDGSGKPSSRTAPAMTLFPMSAIAGVVLHCSGSAGYLDMKRGRYLA